MKYKSSGDVSVEFTPWMGTGYKFTDITLVESLGGSIASGRITMETNGSKESLELITKEYTSKLVLKNEVDGGLVYEMDVFITKKSYIKNYLTLDFLCLKDKKFITDLLISEWDDIGSAIESLYPGKVDIKATSDVGSGVKIFQGAETSYSLCTKLALAFKRKVVFAYGWDGFILRDLESGEEPLTIGPQVGGTFNTTPYELVYDKFLYSIPTNAWAPAEGEEESGGGSSSEGEEALTPLYSTNLVDYSKYYHVGVDYEPLLTNYLYNKRFTKETLYSSFTATTPTLPSYKLGDIVKFKDIKQEEKLPFDTFLVAENRFFMSIEGSKNKDNHGLNLSTTTRLLGIQQGEELFSETDPTESKEE